MQQEWARDGSIFHISVSSYRLNRWELYYFRNSKTWYLAIIQSKVKEGGDIHLAL